MIKRCLLPIALLCTLLFLAPAARAQNAGPADAFIGYWVAKDTGYQISASDIQLLNRQDDGSWRIGHYSVNQYAFVDTARITTVTLYESWGRALYTSRREYLRDGGETSIESAAFRVYRLRLINKYTLQVQISAPYIFDNANKTPQLTREDLQKMKAAFATNKKWVTTLILKKIKAPVE